MAIMTSTVVVNGKRFSFEQAANKARELLAKKEFIKAESIARAIVETHPESAVGLQLLGVILGEQGNYTEAVKYCEAAVAIHPGNAHQYNTLGIYLAGLNQLDRAESAYKESLRLMPNNPDAAYNMGKLLLTKRQYSEAESYLQQALTTGAQGGNIYYNLGACAHQMGNYGQAILWFKLAYNENAEDIESLVNIGICYQDSGQHPTAIEFFEKALNLKPERYDCLLQLAVSHLTLMRHDIAEKYLNEYLEHPTEKIDEINALMTLSGLHKARGDSKRSIEVAKEAVEKHPEVSENFSNALLDMVYSDEVSQEEMFEWCKKYAQYYEAPYQSFTPDFSNTSIPNRKLRIGYVSADFFNHSVSYFALPLVCNHNKELFEVYTYAVRDYTGVVSAQYKKNSHWVSLVGMNEQDVCDRIKADKIDILIDLAGHTGGNQLRVFAKRAAPVQATWLGYPFTTGLSNMDYRIVDAIVEPEGLAEHLSTEKLIRIPGTFCAYRPSISAPERLLTGELDVRTTPAKLNGYVTFGCCNNIAKLTDFTLAMWARIMNQASTARLLIEAPGINSALTRDQLHNRFQKQGIPMDRVIFTNRAENSQYSLYHKIDIALDPYPCNGGTTTCDALFMSVPVVTLSGTRFMSRMGATFLSNIGHPEWVTSTPDAYVQTAVDLASDINHLDQIRQCLRTEVEHSPVMDETGFARKMERAYREMWQAWCLGQHMTEQPGNAWHVMSKAALEEASHIAALYENQAWHALLQASSAYLESHDSDTQVRYYHATALWKTGLVAEALTELTRVCSEQPDVSQYLHTLAHCLSDTGQETVAAQMLHALADPARAQEAHYHLAAWLIKQGKAMSLAAPEANRLFNQAIGFLQHLLEGMPSHVESWALCADIYFYRNQFASAEVMTSRALKLNPKHLPANLTLVKLLMSRSDFSHAESVLLEVARQAPEQPEIDFLLAQAYKKLGNFPYMLKHNATAIQKAPENIKYWSQWLDHAERTGITTTLKYQEKLKEFSQKFGSQPTQPHYNTPDVNKRLKLGICSNEFIDSDEQNLRHKVLATINKDNIETFYYYSGSKLDEQTQFLKEECADHWRFTHGLSHHAIAACMRDDEIDILLDMSGHAAHNFAAVIAQKPAPVIVNWGRVGHTSGLPQVDYLLTDAVVGADTWGQGIHEKPWVLQGAPFIAYTPFINHPERHSMAVFNVRQSPCLERGHITFGSACDTTHLTSGTLNLWASTLLAMPDAKLLLKSPQVAQTAQRALQELGIPASQVQYVTSALACEEFLYQEIDIVLDCTPCNQLETSLNAIWMGVPVVTLTGERTTSRIGASILQYVGHPEWTANTVEHFVEIVQKLSRDYSALDAVRQQLRPALQASALMDMPAYVQAWQNALTQMWKHWCEGEDSMAAHDYWNHAQALQLCNHLLEEDQVDQAWEGYKSILAHWPNCAESLYGLGMIMLGENPEQAIVLLEHAIQGMPATHPKRKACLAALETARAQRVKH